MPQSAGGTFAGCRFNGGDSGRGITNNRYRLSWLLPLDGLCVALHLLQFDLDERLETRGDCNLSIESRIGN